MFDANSREGFERRSGGDPYVRWGETVTFTFAGLGSGVVVLRREFQRATLPRPTLCRLNLSARVFAPLPAPAVPVVDFVRVTYTAGLGSSRVDTVRTFSRLPQVGTVSHPLPVPLDVSWELPLQDLYAFVEAQAFDCSLAVTMWLAPVALEQL